MPVSLLLLAVGLVSLALAYNALAPWRAPAGVALASFFAGWLTGELTLHVLLGLLAAVSVLVYAGALAAWPGLVGAGLCALAAALLVEGVRRSLQSRAVVEAALRELAPDDGTQRFEWHRLVMPIPVTHSGVERLRNLEYARPDGVPLRLDVFRKRGADHGREARRPALVFVHGGGWVIGNKDQQGLPLLHRLAARGWVCFSINYRLSPRATFPDQLVDVKRAIAWVRAHASEHGADPSFIVVSGNSAGAHLASLAALTAGDRALQPGFEDADTQVAACLSFYGVYDFTDRHGHWPTDGLERLLARHVLKVRRKDAPERYEAASPLSHVDAHAPPFLVVHGSRDTVVPVEEGRRFAAALRARSQAPSVYLEIPGAQHAFEVFPSLRALHVLDGVERFAQMLHRRYQRSSGVPLSG